MQQQLSAIALGQLDDFDSDRSQWHLIRQIGLPVNQLFLLVELPAYILVCLFEAFVVTIARIRHLNS
ncbi:hypothetical protein AB3R30_12165 [Leptolyngbyaceae cyanobacterium UHCC 1019]